MAAALRLESVTRRHPGAERPAVNGLSLEVSSGETSCVVGPSGCGKSTMLRMIAGLEPVDSGRVFLGDTDLRDVPPQRRDVAMVFQGFALYPHLRVRDVIGFPLRMQGVPRGERQTRVQAVATMLDIERLLDRYPPELSGGEQQRVAMGRAIVRRPRLFLFDEPLSNLDAALRAQLRGELAELLRDLGTAALFVTHDQIEAMTLGHRIVVLRGGQLEQSGSPREIYERPASVFVARFFGTPPMNVVPPEVFGLTPPRSQGSYLLGVRPERVRLGACQQTDRVVGEGRVRRSEALGADTVVELELDGAGPFRVRARGFAQQEPGSLLPVSFDRHHLVWFDAESERALEP